MTRQLFESWTPEKYETTGETPQDLLRKVEIDELATKYANDWLVKIFLPLGVREILESDIQLLMARLHQPYDAVMSMPCSRRIRLVAKVVDGIKDR